jgi:hypothetical protein
MAKQMKTVWEEITTETPVLDSDGEPILDGEGKPIVDVVLRQVKKSVALTKAEIADLAIPLADQKTTVKEQIKARHAELLNKLTGNYSIEERDTWSMQLRWAQGYLADKNAAHAELLAGMIPDAARQALTDPAQYMTDKILTKDAQAAKLTVIANRAKATANAAVDGAADQAALDAVLAALPDLEAAALAELGL